MKVSQKPFNSESAGVEISGIVEVWLPQNLWQRVQKLRLANSTNARLTFSWITRFALFQMLRVKDFEESQEFQTYKVEATQKIDRASKGSHRHKLCLYGDDEIFLKGLSMRLRIPMSVLIRIALLWYLKFLEKGKMQLTEKNVSCYVQITFTIIRDLGTKIIKQMNFFGTSFYPLFPASIGADIIFFTAEDFW